MKTVQELFPELGDLSGTAKFCSFMNDAFDILNCNNLFSRVGFNLPLKNSTRAKLKERVQEIENYITKIETREAPTLVRKWPRKTGFVGIISCLRNIFPLFDKLRTWGARYFLTSKILQDHLENFFSAVRSRGGFSNNPTCRHFRRAYKRLLTHAEIVLSNNGNCLMNEIPILHCSGNSGLKVDSVLFEEDDENDCEPNEEDKDNFTAADLLSVHDYSRTTCLIAEGEYLHEVITYICGFITRKILKKITSAKLLHLN